MTETWVVYAGIAAWAGLALYMLFLAIRQRRIASRLAMLEILNEKD